MPFEKGFEEENVLATPLTHSEIKLIWEMIQLHILKLISPILYFSRNSKHIACFNTEGFFFSFFFKVQI